jgi:hypothetical protein
MKCICLSTNLSSMEGEMNAIEIFKLKVLPELKKIFPKGSGFKIGETDDDFNRERFRVCVKFHLPNEITKLPEEFNFNVIFDNMVINTHENDVSIKREKSGVELICNHVKSEFYGFINGVEAGNNKERDVLFCKTLYVKLLSDN